MGLTPRQLTWSLVGAHAAVASLAAVLAVPAGLALYAGVYAAAGGSGDDLVLAPWWSLGLVPVATVALVACAMSPPARIATRMPAADALRYE